MSSKDSVTTLKETNSGEHLIGRVKWFNNKAGYGFITVTDGNQSGSDIFVHHSAIGVSNQQYKYLVQGEYVQFSITSTQNSTHTFQASNICGINGGKLMCETRNEFKQARTVYKTTGEQSLSQNQPVSEPLKLPRQQKAPKLEKVDEVQKDWTLIKSAKPSLTQDSERTSTSGRGSAGGRGNSSGRGRGRPRITK